MDKGSRKFFRQRLEHMIEELRSGIVTGKYAAGDFLPSESDLEGMYGLSNQSVRKGLDVLVQERLIEKIPRIGNKVTEKPEKPHTVIRFGYHSTMENDAGVRGLLDRFHALYPHIQVQTVALPTSGYVPFVLEQLQAGLLDVVTVNEMNVRELITQGAADLLQPCDIHPDTYPFLMPLLPPMNPPVVQPLLFSPVIICYNKDHLEECALPEPHSGWTWPELLDYAVRLARPGVRFGFYFNMFMRNRWPIFLLQNGVVFQRDGDGRYVVDDDKLIASLEVGKQLLGMADAFPIALSASDTDAEDLFRDGQVSMIMTTYFGLNELRQANVTYDIAPLPQFDSFRTMLVLIGVAVNRQSAHREEALLLADYMSGYETQQHIRKNTMSIPANRRAAEWRGEESGYRPSRYGMYREIVPSYRTVGDLQLSYLQLSRMQRDVKLYWTGLLNAHDFCRRVEQTLTEAGQGLQPMMPTK
ncbi:MULTISPECIES: extracellular solute-binding protein [Paenibacillus]|uniref:Extracellular solute-binding protein n=1 Tax=Paenibacillus oceani TaxID=2772510 RepID=A0A927CD71_9BACL|nr:extracellular solute-binding protein [Paenibacillus oceani]MBD2865904.1 extracellular solute-binding protein [Paenibacillus oceani]